MLSKNNRKLEIGHNRPIQSTDTNLCQMMFYHTFPPSFAYYFTPHSIPQYPIIKYYIFFHSSLTSCTPNFSTLFYFILSCMLLYPTPFVPSLVYSPFSCSLIYYFLHSTRFFPILSIIHFSYILHSLLNSILLFATLFQPFLHYSSLVSSNLTTCHLLNLR